MKTSIWLPASSALVLILSGCTNQNDPNDPLGTGPYDAQGNYHEEWADDPTKWRKPGKRSSAPADDLPMVAKNDQPPLNANPLATGSQKLPPAVVDSMPRETTRQSGHGQEVEIASRSRSSSGSVKSKSRHTASSDEPKKTTRSSSHNASKSHSKSKSKSKSSSTRHTVKKGDSLSSIAKKYGSSVSAIQKANGLSGTMIRDGKTLVVPKR